MVSLLISETILHGGHDDHYDGSYRDERILPQICFVVLRNAVFVLSGIKLINGLLVIFQDTAAQPT